MEIKRLTREEIESIHNEFKAQLVDLCHAFNAKYLGHNSPYYPQAAYIQLAAVAELQEEMKRQLKTPVGQKWTVIYTHPNGEQGMGMTDHYGMIPNMIEDLQRLNCRNILVRDETIYKDFDK